MVRSNSACVDHKITLWPAAQTLPLGLTESAEPFSAWNKVVARVTVECLYQTLHQTRKDATENS